MTKLVIDVDEGNIALTGVEDLVDIVNIWNGHIEAAEIIRDRLIEHVLHGVSSVAAAGFTEDENEVIDQFAKHFGAIASHTSERLQLGESD